MSDTKNRRLEGHQLVSTIETVMIGLGVIVAIVAVAFLIEHAAERHQITKAEQKITCMENAQDDVTLLACTKTIS